VAATGKSTTLAWAHPGADTDLNNIATEAYIEEEYGTDEEIRAAVPVY
jgi:hypothetical protein